MPVGTVTLPLLPSQALLGHAPQRRYLPLVEVLDRVDLQRAQQEVADIDLAVLPEA